MAADAMRFANTLIPHANYSTESIADQEGEFMWKLIRDNQYQRTIEIGCALGVSSLYICDALSAFHKKSHTIIDPFQTIEYSGIGIRNLQTRGFDFYSLIEELSEIALPKLLEQKQMFDFGFIDGWHTFDHALLDFFYLNRMLRIGGTIVLHDTQYPSISLLIRYLANYPAYRVIKPDGTFLNSLAPTFRQRFFGLLVIAAKWIPLRARREIFSMRVVSGQLQSILPYNIIAFRKVGEDTRNYDWYEPF